MSAAFGFQAFRRHARLSVVVARGVMRHYCFVLALSAIGVVLSNGTASSFATKLEFKQLRVYSRLHRALSGAL